MTRSKTVQSDERRPEWRCAARAKPETSSSLRSYTTGIEIKASCPPLSTQVSSGLNFREASPNGSSHNLVTYDVSYGAITQLYAGTSPDVVGLGGQYFNPWARVGKPRADTQDHRSGKNSGLTWRRPRTCRVCADLSFPLPMIKLLVCTGPIVGLPDAE